MLVKVRELQHKQMACYVEMTKATVASEFAAEGTVALTEVIEKWKADLQGQISQLLEEKLYVEVKAPNSSIPRTQVARPYA